MNKTIRNIMKDLKEISSEDLMQELRLRGWCTQDMWHTDDVTAKYDCTSEQAMDVLEEVLSSDNYMESTFDAIDDQAEHMEYHTIYNNDGE
jgi:hypothetical protein